MSGVRPDVHHRARKTLDHSVVGADPWRVTVVRVGRAGGIEHHRTNAHEGAPQMARALDPWAAAQAAARADPREPHASLLKRDVELRVAVIPQIEHPDWPSLCSM